MAQLLQPLDQLPSQPIGLQPLQEVPAQLLVGRAILQQTTTRTGLVVRAALDPNLYETGIKVSDEELAKVHLKPNKFHGEWNYCIAPRRQSS
jgi:hypothetical protein